MSLVLGQVDWFSRGCQKTTTGSQSTIIDGPEIGRPILVYNQNEGNSEILLSQTTGNTRSLTSKSIIFSTISPASSQTIILDSVPSPSPDDHLGVPIDALCKFSDISFRLLIGGYHKRGPKEIQGIQIRKPHPTIALSTTAPAIFSPGFAEVIRPQFLHSCLIQMSVHVSQCCVPAKSLTGYILVSCSKCAISYVKAKINTAFRVQNI